MSYLELSGVLNLVQIHGSLVCEVVEDIACLFSFLAALPEPAHDNRCMGTKSCRN